MTTKLYHVGVWVTHTMDSGMDIQAQGLALSSFIYDQYTGNRYDGTGDVVLDLNFIEEYPREEKLLNIGWNSSVSVSGSLPNGLIFNSSSDVLSYDGSMLPPGRFNLTVIDDFGSRNLQISYSSIKTYSKRGKS